MSHSRVWGSEVCPLLEEDGVRDTGTEVLRSSVGLDGRHPRGLNELADVIRRKQSSILGRSWRQRTDPWTVKGKHRDRLQDGQEERNFQKWKKNHSMFL